MVQHYLIKSFLPLSTILWFFSLCFLSISALTRVNSKQRWALVKDALPPFKMSLSIYIMKPMWSWILFNSLITAYNHLNIQSIKESLHMYVDLTLHYFFIRNRKGPSLFVLNFVLKLFLINIENTWWSSMFLNFTLCYQLWGWDCS